MSNYTSIEDVQAYVKSMSDSVLNNRDISVLLWETVLDNHIPTRDYGAGFGVKYANDNVDEAYVLFHDEQFGDNRKIGFLVDDGSTIKPFYLASWNESGGFFILHRINSGYGTYGPRKMYHLKLKNTMHTVKNGNAETHVKQLNDFPYVVHTTE